MRLSDAVDRASTNENVRKLKGYFLGSSFACLGEKDEAVKEWTLLYYSAGKHTVIDCFVNEKFVTVGEETPALSEITELDTDDVRVEVEDAIARARDVVKQKPLNVLVSLHNKEIDGKKYVVWTVGVVTADFSVRSFDIDAVSGKILREETTRLLRRV